MRHTCGILLVLCVSLPSAAFVIEGPAGQVGLLELYTSEGCSSCPTADRWLSKLVSDPRLWRELVPVAFHVDYWDDIGWRDRLGSARHTQRQQAYARAQHVRTVYTPGFVWQGREWRGWFQRAALPEIHEVDVGALSITSEQDQLAIRFAADRPAGTPLEVHVLLLGFGITTTIDAGENRGRRLEHDFAVLAHRAVALQWNGSAYSAELEQPQSDTYAGRYALSAWVAIPGDPSPLQAVGGWLAQNQ